MNSEWSELAVLQPAWRRGGPKLSVGTAERRMQIELELCGEVICSGVWDLEVRCDDAAAEMTSNWEEVCWVSDKDADYVEIEAQLSGGMMVQRQILLARKERCLFLADAILGSRPAHWQYQGRLPVASQIGIKPATETREIWLEGRKARLAVLPLALPEWRVDPRVGQLSDVGGGLCLQQAAAGTRLYAPLLIDLDPQSPIRGSPGDN